MRFSAGHDGTVFPLDGRRLGEAVFDDLLAWAAARKASDLTLAAGQPVMAHVADRKHAVTARAVGEPELLEVVRYVYGNNGPSEVHAGRNLDPPAHPVRTPGGVLSFRISVAWSRTGPHMTVRALPADPPRLDELGVEPEIVANLRPRNGLSVVSGAVCSGKTTLLASAVRWMVERDDAEEKVLEYSRPVEFRFDKVVRPPSLVIQMEAGTDIRPAHLPPGAADEAVEEALWAYCMRHAVRNAPSVVVLGEARDRAAIRACIEAGLLGVLVLTSMHAPSVPETLRRAVVRFPWEERQAASVDLMLSLRLLVNQTLLPRVGGGVVACREFLVLDEEVRAELLRRSPDEWPQAARAMLASQGGPGRSMERSARLLLEGGVIGEDAWRRVAARAAGD